MGKQMGVQHKQYKDHDIRSSPFVLPDVTPTQWKVRLDITSPPVGQFQTISEYLDEMQFYPTEEQAHEAGFEYARYIIDGNRPNRGSFSTNNL